MPHADVAPYRLRYVRRGQGEPLPTLVWWEEPERTAALVIGRG